MPSWNVHTAHVQRLLREVPAAQLGIRDVNSFLFGNFVPDILVGYMVPNPTKVLPYTLTHCAKQAPIPIPREREFWDTYVEPGGPEGISVSGLEPGRYEPTDVILGAWAHLTCDNVYNSATRAWIDAHGVQAGEQTRIRKQGDFDKFGRTLPITLLCEETPGLLWQAAAFPQYAVDAPDARRAVAVARGIVRDNQAHHLEHTPEYSLFTEDFFLEVFEHANEVILERLLARAKRLGF